MSYFFSSQRLDAITPTYDFASDDEEDESGGIFIVEANNDPPATITPHLLDHVHIEQEPALTTDLLQSSSNSQDFQDIEVSVPLDEVDLSQSDLRSLDELFSIQDHTNSVAKSANPASSLPRETILKERETENRAKNIQSPRVDVLAGGTHDFSLSEVFQNIGSFQMKQSLELHTDQDDKSIAKLNRSTINRTIWDIMLTSASVLRWLLWSLPARILFGAFRSLLLIASVFAGVWIFGRLSCGVISSVYNSVSSLVVRVWSLGAHVYGIAKINVQSRAAGASGAVVTLWAAATTFAFFGATLCLLKLCAITALQMLHTKIASAITRPIWNSIDKIRSILHFCDNVAPKPLPKRSSVLARRIDDLFVRPFDTIVEMAPVPLESKVDKLHKEGTLPYRYVSWIDNVIHMDSKFGSDPDFKSPYVPAAHNQSSGFRELSAHPGLFSLKVNSSCLIAPMNFVFLVSVALFYVWLPRKCITAASTVVAAKSEEAFTSLNGKSLEVEFEKRGLKAPALRQDRVRHLCLHDGIPHTFAQRDVNNYSHMTKVQLKLALSDLGVHSSGNKKDLQYRLLVAREDAYKERTEQELKKISRQFGVAANGNELARRLAEAGPHLPL